MNASSQPVLELKQVVKKFGSNIAVDHVSLAVARGEFISLLGPSGCGKTTTLRMIAGLEQASQGTIQIGGKNVTSEPAYRRDIGMVFQSLALFPHMTVAQNVGFGLRMRGMPATEIEDHVTSALKLVRLVGYEKRFPDSISGGQQQRVALARALAARPALLLFDDPFSALDRKLREELTVEFAELLHQVDATTVFVTHDQEEAFAMSNRVAVMQSGRILQLHSPTEVFTKPANLEVARFVGMSNMFKAKVDASGTTATCAMGTLALPKPDIPGRNLMVGVRPENIRITPNPQDTVAHFDAVVLSSTFRGRFIHIALSLPTFDERIEILLAHGLTIPAIGERVRCSIGKNALHLMHMHDEGATS